MRQFNGYQTRINGKDIQLNDLNKDQLLDELKKYLDHMTSIELDVMMAQNIIQKLKTASLSAQYGHGPAFDEDGHEENPMITEEDLAELYLSTNDAPGYIVMHQGERTSIEQLSQEDLLRHVANLMDKFEELDLLGVCDFKVNSWRNGEKPIAYGEMSEQRANTPKDII